MKAKKTAIRPNLAKLDCCKFKGQTIDSQYAKRYYKVSWRPIGIKFSETTTPEPEIGPPGQKISSDKKLKKSKLKVLN